MLIGVCAKVAALDGIESPAFDYIEENVQSFLVPTDTAAAFSEIEKQKRVRPVLAANCFLPASLPCTGPDAELEPILRYAETAFQRAERVGIRRIVFGSGGARQLPEGFDREQAFEQFSGLLAALGPLAEKSGVVVVVEPLNRGECNFINSLEEGARVVEAAGHPHIRLLADFFHMLRDGEGPEAIQAHGHLLSHVHVAENRDRACPGTNGEDFTPFLLALKNVGYEGNISIEAGWTDLAAQVNPSVEFLKKQIQAVGC